jgi:hypothetical protein
MRYRVLPEINRQRWQRWLLAQLNVAAPDWLRIDWHSAALLGHGPNNFRSA